MESNSGSEMKDVRAVANRDHQAVTGMELSFKQGRDHFQNGNVDVLRSAELFLKHSTPKFFYEICYP